jgi:hypothetical protein
MSSYKDCGINLNNTYGERSLDLDKEGELIKSFDSFTYLDSIITNAAKCDKDIQNKIPMVYFVTKRYMESWSKNISKEIKKNIFHRILRNILLYIGAMGQLTKN